MLDQSHSAASSELLAHIEGTGIFERVRTISSTNQIADCIDSGDALMVLVIGQDFADKLANGQQAAVQILMDGRNSTTAGEAASYISSIINHYNENLNGGVLPLRFAIEAVRCIYLEGATLSQEAHNFPPMLVVAAATMPTAAWLFRNKLS